MYRELETDGLVQSRVRHGTVVAAARRESAAVAHEQLEAAARSYAATAGRLGLSLEEVTSALHRRWAHPPEV